MHRIAPTSAHARAVVPCARRNARDPEDEDEASNPVLEEDEELEYLVYGWFKFKLTDAENVKRLGRQWVPVEGMSGVPLWSEKEDKFDARVRDMRLPHAEPAPDTDGDDDEG